MISGRTAVDSQSDRNRIVVVTTVLASRSCSVRSSAVDRASPAEEEWRSVDRHLTHPRRPPGRVTGSRPQTRTVRPNTGQQRQERGPGWLKRPSGKQVSLTVFGYEMVTTTIRIRFDGRSTPFD